MLLLVMSFASIVKRCWCSYSAGLNLHDEMMDKKLKYWSQTNRHFGARFDEKLMNRAVFQGCGHDPSHVLTDPAARIYYRAEIQKISAD